MLTDEFINDLNLANYLAMQQAPEWIPTYLAQPTRSGLQMTFYCHACERPHWHGCLPGTSHYVAHCLDQRAHPNGYYVALIEGEPAVPLRPPETNAGRLYPKHPALPP